MFIAEVKTKDENKGTLVASETAKELYQTLTKWAKEECLKAKEIAESDLIFGETGGHLGVLSFNDDLSIAFEPYAL